MSLSTSVCVATGTSIFRYAIVILTLFSLTISSLVFTPLRQIRAANAPQTPVPISAPPEPFVVRTPTVMAGIYPTLAEAFSSAANWFAIDQPEGLGAVKPPTLANKFTNSLGSLFGLAKPSAPIAAPAPPNPPAGIVKFDFDGDGVADIGRWHPSNAEFKIKASHDGSDLTYSVGCNPTTTTGCGSAQPVPGNYDFDYDGITDAAVFSAGTWTIRKSSNGDPLQIQFGAAGDIPVTADYDGDGKVDIAVFRPSTGAWWVLKGGSTYDLNQPNSYYSVSFGQSGDIPVPGNYYGDGVRIAVYRPSDGTWYVRDSSGGFGGFQWGVSSDIPVPADFDGDGRTDVAVFRRTTGTWYILKSGTNFTGYDAVPWGNYADQPTPADYDGDGKADYAVFRPTTGMWWILKSSSNYTTNGGISLGVDGDIAVPSSYLRQVGGFVTSDQLAAARLSPRNATGSTDLYSQNFSWGTTLVSLPGRAGLDLNLGIGYNSLVWTKAGNAMVFDADTSNVSPGFRFGFPTIEPTHYDATKQKFGYMMVSPSGSRVEFRQTTVSNVYETADSSYAQLVALSASNPNVTPGPNDSTDSVTIVVITTDGTRMTYEWKSGAYRCSQIKDRNGNYITIEHDSWGYLHTVTDTLNRVVSVEYDTDGYPSKVKQDWISDNGHGAAIPDHLWATFTYTTKQITPHFDASLSLVGPPDGMTMKVLDHITYTDGSSTKFDYNGYGQVYKVSQIAADAPGHILNSVRTDLDAADSPNVVAHDCPRFTLTQTTVENFNGGGPVTTHNSTPVPASGTLPGGISGPALVVDQWMDGNPDNLHARMYFGSSDWQEGLPIATEDCLTTSQTCSDRKRWTTTTWTQDDTSKSYILNPRVTETRVGDTASTKRTTTDYRVIPGTTNTAEYGLPSSVKVYDAQSNVIKQVDTDYNLSGTYTTRRIIGLPSKVETWGRNDTTHSLEYVSKVTYDYDQGSLSDSTLNQNISPTQHDGNYGSSFIQGRGNLTSTKRWDTANTSTAANIDLAIESTVKYNTAGSPVAQTGPWDGTRTRTVRIGYTDSWNDTTRREATYAYPTVITGPGGNSLGDPSHSSTVKYRYDLGAKVETTSPAPAGNADGKKTGRIYNDQYGYLERSSLYVGTTEYAYTRYEYPNRNGIQVNTYSTVSDVDGDNVGGTADEVVSETWLDGAGRTRMWRTPHTFNPDGSPATWAASLVEYDILGRTKRRTIPTEVDGSWHPTGDDYRGMVGNNYVWLWNSQEYDWKGRTTRIVNPEGTDRLFSYEGCGCAGGQVTTIKGEATDSVDMSGNLQTGKRRTLKTYEDILGRTIKTELWDLDGAGTAPYSTNTFSYNGRDQVVSSIQYAGNTTGIHQETTAAFDGFGRLISSHRPEQQNSNGNVGYTTYSYNSDGSVSTVTDARGAAAHYAYNFLGLIDSVDWTVSAGSTIPVPHNVNFTYDTLGNRTSMTDGLGSVTYEYDPLSRVKAETRQFTDNMPEAPMSGNRFRLEYSYGLSGQVVSYKDPFGEQINRGFDRRGRLIDVTGSSFGGVTDYAGGAAYTAWGGLKEVDYADDSHLDIGHNDSMQISSYTLRSAAKGVFMNKSYSYYSDRKVRYIQDLIDPKFDRLNIYDHSGRIKEGKSGAEARGGTVPESDQERNLPYRQSYTFDAFGNMTESTNRHWGVTSWGGQSFDQSFEYTNNKVQQLGWAYDEDGRNTANISGTEGVQQTFNAAGQMIRSLSAQLDTNAIFDGNGAETKRQTQTLDDQGNWQAQPTTYYIRSSVLNGRVISEVWANGQKHRSFVEGIGNLTAVQTEYPFENYQRHDTVMFEYSDAMGMSYRTTDKSGVAVATGDGGEGSPIETDPLGGSVGTFTPYINLVVYDPSPEYPELQPYNAMTESPYPAPDFGSMYATFGSRTADLPGFGTNWGSWADFGIAQYSERVANARAGFGFITNEEYAAQAYSYAATHTAAGISAGHEAFHDLAGGSSGNTGGGSGGGSGIAVGADQSTADVDLENNIVTVRQDDFPGFMDLENDPVETLFKKFQYFRTIVDSRVKFIGDPNGLVMSNIEGLKARLTWLIGLKSCNDEFQRSLGKTPLDVLRERGLYITDYASLENQGYADALGIGESDRLAMLARRDEKKPDASTITDLPIGVVTIFNEKNISVSWFWRAYYGDVNEATLNEAVPHEMIHGAGKGPDPFKNPLSYSHDLSGWDPYNRVIDKCKIPLGLR